ncbi:hypothetical protein M885DRAFT_505915 [Pelagophyceae sp. CCMP2097]|nr:hypothetical protein M885DRAFT_505915 [Pelagophyceae sp. CCMP2097]
MDRFFGVDCVEGRFAAQLTIPGGAAAFQARPVRDGSRGRRDVQLRDDARRQGREDEALFQHLPVAGRVQVHRRRQARGHDQSRRCFDKMNQKRADAKKPLPPLYVAGVEALRKSFKGTLPAKRFDDEFFVAVDYLRKQSGRKKLWRRKIERSGPLPEAAAGGDELVPDPMLLGELRAIRRWNRWLAARGLVKPDAAARDDGHWIWWYRTHA